MDNNRTSKQKDDHDHDHDDDEVPLPGFRFYPTDEELVGFYLRRKVEKRPISMELIKQIDIYKFDPWDLPTSTVGDNEWYFYCKRGRKYRNSVRPNRVTGSGFWKATGIDKPIYSADHQGAEARRDCIGLKKSLVYYRGNAGKGTKTDWMMHEFRLPDHPNAKNNALEAEVWTLCRIFKRNVAYRKYTSNWREISTKQRDVVPSTETSSKTCSVESATQEKSNYISFRADPVVAAIPQNDKKPNIIASDHISTTNEYWPNQYFAGGQLVSSSASQSPFTAASSPSFSNLDGKNDFFMTNDNWDELSSVLGFSVNRFSV